MFHLVHHIRMKNRTSNIYSSSAGDSFAAVWYRNMAQRGAISCVVDRAVKHFDSSIVSIVALTLPHACTNRHSPLLHSYHEDRSTSEERALCQVLMYFRCVCHVSPCVRC